MINFGTGSTVTNVFLPNRNPVDTAKQGLVFASRVLNENNQLILPFGSTPMPSLYIPFQLPAYTSAVQALVDLGLMGFQYTQGISFEGTYSAPDNVSINNITGLEVLTWNSATIGLQNLQGQSTNGSITQDNSSIISTGTIVSINIVGNQTVVTLTLVDGSPNFTDANPVTIDALLSSGAPDPATSDMVCLGAYWFYNQYATAAKFTTSANIWMSVTVEGRDTSISPTATPIVLVTPTSVTAPGDGSLNLAYPLTAYQLGLLPTQYLGQTTVTQSVALPTNTTQSIYYADGIYLRGSAGTAGIDYSEDGTNWLPTNVTTHMVNAFFWNGSVYVAATNAGLYYSVNGSTWTVSNTSTGTFKDVKFANTKFVATSTAGLFYSSDGITWTGCSGDDNASFTAVVYGVGTAGGVWVAVTLDDDAYNSTDGITFAALSESTDGFLSATFANGLFQLGGVGTGIVYSTDGTTFTPSNLTTLNINAITFNSDLDIWLAGTSVGIYSSINGIAWTVTGSPTATGVFKAFTYSDTELVAASTVGLYRSTNGTTWALALGSGATGSYTSVLYNDGLFLAGNASGLSQSADGITWVTGSATIEGIFNGYTLSSTQCILNVVDITGGTYNTTNTITIVLDISQNGGVLTGENEISCFAVLNNIHDVSTLTTTYSDFYDLISALQAPVAAESNKFNVQGYYGYSPAIINQYPIASVTAPNVTYFKMSARLDIPTPFQYPNLPVTHVMATMYQNLNNETPFADTSGRASILNIQASTNQSTLPSNTILNQLTNQGITAIGALPSRQMYAYRDVCTLQSIGGIPDTEFRYEPLQLKTRWLDKNVVLVAEATVTLPNGMRDNNNPELITTMIANMNQVLLVGFNAGMLGNTKNDVSVTINPSDVSRLLIAITTTIVPANSGSDITVFVKSYSV